MDVVAPSADSPACTEHSQEAVGTVVSTRRRRREGRKESNDSSSSHLEGVIPFSALRHWQQTRR